MKPLSSENSQEFQKELVILALKDDQEAISQLYEMTYSHVYHTIKSMVQDEDEVLDIVQDSFVKAFASLDQLDKPENFCAWMKRIATNKAKDYFKKKRPILFSEMANENDEDVDFQDDRIENLPEAVLDQQETTRLIDEILHTLSDEQRLVIGMHYYEQMSVKEIAKVLGCSENTVKSRLNYGRKKVETKVLDLEKHGTKLYSLAPLPFLLWLFRMDAQAASVSSVPSAERILSQLQNQRAGNAAATAGNTAASAAGNAAASAGVKAAGAGGKALVTKIVAGVLAAAVIGGGAVAVMEFNGKRDPAHPTQPTEATVQTESVVEITEATAITETSVPTETPLPPMTAELAYEDAKNDYRKAISATQDTYEQLEYQFINPKLSALFYYYMSTPDFDFYTANYDINHDGSEELLIGFGNDSNIQVVDVYSFDGEKPYHLVDQDALGSGVAQLQIMTDGTMYYCASLDFSSSVHALTKIAADGYSVETIENCSYNAGDDDSKLQSVNEKVAACTPVTEFSWTLLTADQGTFEPNQVDAAIADCDRIRDEYRMLYTMPHDDFNNDSTLYERYPYLDSMMYYYHSDPDAFVGQQFYCARADIDGDGIPEFLIGFGKEGDIQLCNSFAWNGTEMERLGAEGKCMILADGIIVDHIGNGGEISGVYKLENSRPVDHPDTEIQPGDYEFSAEKHGGYFTPDWGWIR